jgi:hypothetical protein
VIPARLRAIFRDAHIHYCVIGAHALAVHGVARYTADVDLLTIDRRVLDPRTWPEDLAPTLREGDDEDPLEGVARFEDPAVDVIVGRGPVMQGALAASEQHELLEDPVVTPLWLALLKLEAGGVQDLADVELLIEARRRRGEDLRAQIATRRSLLGEWGSRAWERLQRRLDEDA